MSRSGRIDAQGAAIAAAINAEPAAERTAKAAYVPHEGKLYVERDQDQSVRSRIYLSNRAMREAKFNTDQISEVLGARNDIKYVLNIPEYDLYLLRKIHPEARHDAPPEVRAKFFSNLRFTHPEYVVIG